MSTSFVLWNTFSNTSYDNIEGLPTSKNMNEKMMPLSHLACGARGWVSSVCCTSGMRRRLLDIGLIPGTEVVCLGASPLGDPRVYLVRGKMIAIRSRDAGSVVIRG